MKNLLIVFALVALVLCDKPRLRDVKRKQFRKEIIDCILNNENSSEELKNKVKKEIDDEYRKILHIFIAKLNQEDREIIRKCRRIYFGKIRDMYKERMNQKYNKNYTHHHIHDEEQLHSTSSLVSNFHKGSFSNQINSAHSSHSRIKSNKTSSSYVKPMHSSSAKPIHSSSPHSSSHPSKSSPAASNLRASNHNSASSNKQ